MTLRFVLNTLSLSQSRSKLAINLLEVAEAFFEFNVNLMSIYVLQGVGKKVRIRELMGIASADENNDHVISVKKYNSLKDAIKKAVYIKIGTSNSLSSIFFFIWPRNILLGRMFHLHFPRNNQHFS